MYAISVQQSHGFMSDKPETKVFKQNDITDIWVLKKSFTQIGATGNGVWCRNMIIRPSGLTIPIYISEHDKDYLNVLVILLAIVKDNVKRVEISLSLPELSQENYQTITIWKMEE